MVSLLSLSANETVKFGLSANDMSESLSLPESHVSGNDPERILFTDLKQLVRKVLG